MATTYTLISSNVLGSATANVTFSSIPATYTDLVVRISARIAFPSNFTQLDMTINGVTSALYSKTQMAGVGAGAGRGLNQTKETMENQAVGDSATASTFSNMEIYIPNYTGTTSTPMGIFAVTENNTATGSVITGQAGLYRGTAAITTLLFAPSVPVNLMAGSSFYLYGIKKS